LRADAQSRPFFEKKGRMLTAIRNVVDVLANFDEHHLGHEESMEPMYSKQYCETCEAKWRTNLKNVNGKLTCEFCRRNLTKAITRPEPHLTRFRRWLAGLIAPKKQYSVVNDPTGG
jgi:hypothetical protein